LAYWRAVGLLRIERALGLRELDTCLNTGATPNALDGRTHGRLLATTLGKGLDGPFEAVTRLWMPWMGNEHGKHGFSLGSWDR
jgi:hypothetical protein